METAVTRKSVMSNITLDSQWVIESLSSISEKLATLPAIEKHLSAQNHSIEKTSVAVTNLDLRITGLDIRISTLERAASISQSRWTNVLSSAIRVVEGLALAYLLAKMGGII